MKIYEIEFQVSTKGNFKRKFTRELIARNYSEAKEKGNLVLRDLNQYDNIHLDYIKYTEKGNIISDYTILQDIKEILSEMEYSDYPMLYHMLKNIESKLKFKVENGYSELFGTDNFKLISELRLVYMLFNTRRYINFAVEFRLAHLIDKLERRYNELLGGM